MAVSREHLVYGNSSLHLQPIRTMAIPGTTTSVGDDSVSRRPTMRTMATAVRFCADQAQDSFASKPWIPRIHPGIEICNDRPAVRKAAEPLVRCFKSVHWVVRWRLSDGEVPLTHWLTDPLDGPGQLPCRHSSPPHFPSYSSSNTACERGHIHYNHFVAQTYTGQRRRHQCLTR